MPILRIDYNDTFDEIEFETRNAIPSEQVQNFIKDSRDNSVDIKCLCVTKNNEYPRIISASLPSNNAKFTLRRNSKDGHAEDCIFHDERKNFYDEKKNSYRAQIFDETEVANNERKKRIIYTSPKETVRRATYSNFCLDLLSESISFAFNIANKTKPRAMFTIGEYFKALSINISNKKMADGRKVLESLPLGRKLSFGFIREDLEDVQNGVMQLEEYNRWNGNFEIVNVEIEDRRLIIAQNRQKNHGNIFGGPYIYMAVYKEEYGTRKIIRLYTYAIELFDDKFSFVDSGLERIYARTLLENNIVFIKPINGHEHETLKKDNYIDGEIPNLKYKCDFIEFRDHSVKIVEVCGFSNDKEYMRSLENKEIHYRALEEEGKIEYLRYER